MSIRLTPGATFGRYEVELLLGEGGMGSVYQATDTTLARKVALKLLRPDKPDGGPSRGGAPRLVREARAAAAIEHANAVKIHDVGEIDGIPYIAMELIVGRSLRTYVGDASVPLELRTRWLLEVARALAAAHARGLVHRDVKPENVMIRDDGVVKLLDFGIVGTQGGASASVPGGTFSEADFESWRATCSYDGILVGTPRYMSPEQFRGDTLDGRTDQFAWGVMAYEVLSGSPPWLGDVVSLSGVVEVLEKTPPPLRDLVPGVRPALSSIVDRALSKAPEDRFASMGDLVRELASLPVSTGMKWARPWALAAGVLALMGGGALAMHRTGRECQELPSFTPDGKHVVFDATRGATSAIMIADLDGGPARPLTKPTLWDFAANVSPDGALIAFLRANREGAVGTWTARLDGSNEPQFLASGQVRPSFTPDGSAIWAGEHDHPSRFDLGTRHATRHVESPAGAVAPMGRELPDGRYLVVFPQGNGAAASGLAAFAKDGSLSWLSHDNLNEVLAIPPGEGVVIAARQTETNNVELLAIPLDGRPSTPLPTRDVLPTEGLAFSRDGKNVTWSTCHTSVGLVYVTDDGRFTPVHDPVEWDESAAAPIPGTGRLVAISARSGPSSLWVLDPATGEARELRARIHGSPSQLAVSPDGRFVAVQLGAGLSLVPVDGGAPRPLTNDATDGSPAFRRDGRELLFTRTSTPEGALRVHVVDIAGAAIRPLLAPGSSSAATCSHDDRIAYLVGEDHSKVVPMITDPNSPKGEPRRLSPDLRAGSYRSVARSPDGIHVGFLASLVYTDQHLLVARSLFVGNIWLADLTR